MIVVTLLAVVCIWWQATNEIRQFAHTEGIYHLQSKILSFEKIRKREYLNGETSQVDQTDKEIEKLENELAARQ